MGLTTPLTLRLYDPETDEIKKEFTRSYVPWGLLKKAIRLQKLLDSDDLKEEDVDELTGLVVAAFNDQFTVEELNNGSDLGEMMSVLQNIIARASVFVEGRNPTQPAG